MVQEENSLELLIYQTWEDAQIEIYYSDRDKFLSVKGTVSLNFSR
jgi:hypothetical protein